MKIRAVVNNYDTKRISKFFIGSNEFRDLFGFHPNQFKRILGTAPTPCLVVVNKPNPPKYYWNRALCQKLIDIQRKVIDRRAKILGKLRDGATSAELNSAVKKDKTAIALVLQAETLCNSSEEARNLRSKIKGDKIIRYEEATPPRAGKCANYSKRD